MDLSSDGALLLRAIVGAIVGATVGAVLWAKIGEWTGREIGWIAWGLGGLVGLTTMLAAGGPSARFGAIAAIAAIAGIAGGKVLAVQWSLAPIVLEESKKDQEMLYGMLTWQMGTDRHFTDEVLAQIDQQEGDGVWPDELMERVRIEVEHRAGQLSDRDHEILSERWADEILKDVPLSEQLTASMALFDLLWALLAIGTAFKVAQGGLRP